MPKNKPPAFQFYVKDYLSGAARRMTLAGLGAYLNLLCTAWDSDPIGTLPIDPEKIRRLAGATVEEWAQIKDEVVENFVLFEHDPTRFVNKRLRQQWQELANYHEKLSQTASERGKRGAQKRWGKKTDSTAKDVEPTESTDSDSVDIVEDEV
jgi:uncharacterized protein YdaU (DUF1376 family)